jgi:RimJ/RimL family protein N-acetyltransferase
MDQKHEQPLSLTPLGADTLARALLIRSAPEQAQFAGTADSIINGRKPSEDVHLICKGDEVLGLFKIDHGYAQEMPFCKAGQLGLRGFIVDVPAQGKGIGRQATEMLGKYLSQCYPAFSSVLLTVNCKNTQAQRAYLKGGFTDTAELYHGGAAGPQHIYRKDIK